ncbi:hypothetical protein GDO78_022265 [Eleutherodactylus coqui]|uniref:Uncharacterized protein n=1 Tax=Eleutherodactylus coqui TaxID=57060 RepID=A0A8J6E2P8_ELECQ|nr:hypothetical protein GDO78_022265 [Eleutherodactylus coqui]
MSCWVMPGLVITWYKTASSIPLHTGLFMLPSTILHGLPRKQQFKSLVERKTSLWSKILNKSFPHVTECRTRGQDTFIYAFRKWANNVNTRHVVTEGV